MRLKNIRAYGFKSFADKVDIHITSNITAIVGPNGSGKSNIVDAVRWVLGEQSVKSLRGTQAMSDVIFAGSKSRSPYKRAEVSLVFDNSDHTLHTDFTEVEVKRVIYLTGENEYFLNGSKVRLKDITDLFLDTGAGTESFNIIGQGSIDSIVSAKPIDRRVIFEEAAGVLKYKKRKEEALRKLEKTKDNMDKVRLVIEELEKSVLPLKEQSAKAKEYLSYKNELENTEIALLARDIKSYNLKYAHSKEVLKNVEEELNKMSLKGNEKSGELEKKKLKILHLEEEINTSTEELILLANKISTITSDYNIALERKKNGPIHEIESRILNLKEEILPLEKRESVLEESIQNLQSSLRKKQEEESNVSLKLQMEVGKRSGVLQDIASLKKEILEKNMQKSVLETAIENGNFLPLAVRNILNNPRLEGIHNTIARLITFSDELATALEVSLGGSAHFLVVDNESVAKNCIGYLKNNKLGRATFFPLNVIRGRKIASAEIEEVKKDAGFIGVFSELVTFDEKYRGIIENQLGNILLVKDIDAMQRVGKLLNYRYRVVTLEGEILYTGGSLSGGSLKNQAGVLKEKQDLEKVNDSINRAEDLLKDRESDRQRLEESIAKLEEKAKMLAKEIYALKEEMSNKEYSKKDVVENLHSKQKELEGILASKENHLEDTLFSLMEEANTLKSRKEILENKVENKKKEKSEISSLISSIEQEIRTSNQSYNQTLHKQKTEEITLGKLEVQLDTMLKTLNEEYNLSYENASLHYPLEMEEEIAREKVVSLKGKMARLGIVNLGAIEEYERVNTRYEFLLDQRNDLEEASNDLLEVIDEMDGIMVSKFQETFTKIQKEFGLVFKKLFKGGEGSLKLTDPENLLETGVDISAQPPGKKLTNIALLSGGEKTLTAISLLFAILNVKPVPFCILDEVEAALDEANVDQFGSYLQEKKENSEFILITHKKKTMEYADTLYGITMQESGVSKIVSVKLENLEN